MVGWRPTCKCYGTPEFPEYPREASGEELDKIKEERLRLVEIYKQFDTVPCTVLDPFAGSGTVGEWCVRNNRDAILIELNPEYKQLIENRIQNNAAMSIRTEGSKTVYTPSIDEWL
jgi:hypothetical protein